MHLHPPVPSAACPRTRLLGRAVAAAGAALAVLAGVAAAPLGAQAVAAVSTAQLPATEVVPRTVRVDPERCAAASPDPAVTVVCTVDEVAAHLIDRTAVVLSGVRHRGALDLRGRTGLRVRGEAGAVLDADGGRYALSLRDVADVAVEGLVLQGGTAQTVWVERTRDVRLTGVTVSGSAGAGVQLRESAGFALSSSRISGAASAGVMELTGVTDSLYADLVVTGNGRGAAVYNGDGLQLAGTRVTARDLVVSGNGSSALYEHGVYVSAAARSVQLRGLTVTGNAGVAVKLGGSGTLERSRLTDDRIALYCARTAAPGWRVRTTALAAPRPSAAEPGCELR